MDNKEAIEYLKWIRPIRPYSLDKIKVQESIDLAIKVLEERSQGEWEYEHELSCGRILRLRLNVVEHKCNKCKHWSIKWAKNIPDNYCSHCGEVMRKGGAE